MDIAKELDLTKKEMWILETFKCATKFRGANAKAKSWEVLRSLSGGVLIYVGWKTDYDPLANLGFLLILINLYFIVTAKAGHAVEMESLARKIISYFEEK